ncbi:MAG TPA: hypothetical protein VES42_07910 [Pilimelia sp.]|nr:hypothetical protein [Pilimelia sp.]
MSGPMTRVTVRLLLPTLSAALIGIPAAAASAAPEPAAESRPVGAVSYVGTPTLDKSGELAVPKPQERAATAADAARTADRLNQMSFVNPLAVAAASDPKRPPAVPDGADAQECLNSPNANTAFGRIHNRFLWCQRWQVEAFRGSLGPQPGGIKLATMTMSYTAVAYGRDDGNRSATIFFRGDDLDLWPVRKGYLREDSMLYQRIGCAGGSSPPSTPVGCDSAESYVGKRLDQWTGEWTSWTVSSAAGASSARDSVLRHQWSFQGYVVDSFAFRLADAESERRTIRCDSSTVFGKKRQGACIHDDVTPHLQYSVNDPKVKEVAEHIRCAQEALTCVTHPVKDNAKLIPGKFIEGQRNDLTALHRVRSSTTNSPVAEANRRVVRAACARLPIEVYDTAKGQECDEYPFASTMEGAACCEPPKFDWDYSIKGVPGDVNGCAGRALKKYYREDRILYEQDGFFVRITDTPPTAPEFCDAIPADEDEPGDGGGGGGGGGEPVENLPPIVGAGPDVAGEEGAPVALGGTASDPESGTPNVRWSYRAVQNVDAGATCAFGNTSSAGTSVTCTDDGVFEVTITGSDGVNAAVSDSALVTLSNVAPGLGTGVGPMSAGAPGTAAKGAGPSIAADPPEDPGVLAPAPWQLFRKGAAVESVVSFTDPAENDTHVCVTDWDDGSTSRYAAEDRTCRLAHTFDRAGMFTINTVVTDDDGAPVTGSVLVVVYDPDGPWANSDGSFDSPAGALTAQPDTTGEGWFHLSGRYYPQDTTRPAGSARGWLPHTDYRFGTDGGTLDWLVVTPDGKVAAKGSGTLAGRAGRYGFVFYGYDGCAQGGTAGACQAGPDRFRGVVWPLSAGPNPGQATVYDNRASAGYDVDVTEPAALRTGTVLIQSPN